MDLDSELLAYAGAAVLTLLYIIALVFFGRRAARGPIYRWLVLVFSLGLVVTGLFLSQWVAIQKEQESLHSRIRKVSIAVENAAVTSARLPEFRSERERRRLTLLALRQILPEELEVEAYLKGLARHAEARSVQIVSTHTVTRRLDFYEEAATRLVLEGDDESVAALQQAVRADNRLARWENHADGTVTITIYAVKVAGESAPEPCGEVDDEPTSELWLPLQGDSLTGMRDELDERCQTLERLLPIHLQIHEYHNLLKELEAVESVIEGVKSSAGFVEHSEHGDNRSRRD